MQNNTLSLEQSMPAGLSVAPGEYLVNEIFYTIQGEGKLAGTPMVFVRLARCNLRCTVKNVGFDCDTDFQGYRVLSAQGVVDEVKAIGGGCQWVLFTGGEPGLQLDEELFSAFRQNNFKIAIETNGTIKLPSVDLIDHITCSPKSAEHTIRQREVDEVRLVRAYGQALPGRDDLPFKGRSDAGPVFYVSPAFEPSLDLMRRNLDWCLDLVKGSPGWRLSLQTHKIIGVR